LTVGPDGAFWYGIDGFPDTSYIGRMTTMGAVSSYALPNNNLGYGAIPLAVTTGPDGNLWEVDSSAGKIMKISPTGTVLAQYQAADLVGSSGSGIVTGSDGNLWFTEDGSSGTNKIARITPSGSITQYALSSSTDTPDQITVGSGGSLWFGESDGNAIGRITTSGVITQFAIPTQDAEVHSVTTGPDGNVWFAETGSDKVGRITPAGVITEYTLPSGGRPDNITSGPDGNLWFTDTRDDALGVVTPAGAISEYSLPDSDALPEAITTGPDGAIWFTYADSSGTTFLGQFIIPTTPVAPANLTAPTPTNQAPVLSWDAVTGATSYNVYRDGTNIGSATGTSFADDSLTSDGTYTYSVTAVNASGESSQSNTVSVVYDVTPPTVTITGVTAGETYNTLIAPACDTTDSGSGVAVDAALTVSSSGNSYTATCSGATDNAGNIAPSVSATYTLLPANYTLVNLSDSNGDSLSNAKVTFDASNGTVTTLTTDSFGNAYLDTSPGSYKVTAYYANGYESETITTTASGPNDVSFATVPVTVTINDPNAADLSNAIVAQAGNTGTFGPKTPVNNDGQAIFQVLPGRNYFTAYVAGGYQEQVISAEAGSNNVTFNTYAVQVTVLKEGVPLATAIVKQAGNSGSFGSGESVDSNGQYTFYVLPGTNYFEAFDGPDNYTKQTLTVTADTGITLDVN
jgi:streptogramin lyase